MWDEGDQLRLEGILLRWFLRGYFGSMRFFRASVSSRNRMKSSGTGSVVTAAYSCPSAFPN
jgi:hypothetical protein